jgi:hypothetical protein
MQDPKDTASTLAEATGTFIGAALLLALQAWLLLLILPWLGINLGIGFFQAAAICLFVQSIIK